MRAATHITMHSRFGLHEAQQKTACLPAPERLIGGATQSDLHVNNNTTNNNNQLIYNLKYSY